MDSARSGRAVAVWVVGGEFPADGDSFPLGRQRGVRPHSLPEKRAWADARHVGASALVWLSCRAGEPVRMGPDRGRLPLLGKTVWMCRELIAG